MIFVSSVAYGIFYAYSNYQTTTKDCLPLHAKKNYEEFVHCLEDGANLGNLRNQVTLAHLYMTGEAVPANHAESIKWARKAAERDEPNAQNLLGSALGSVPSLNLPLSAADPADHDPADQLGADPLLDSNHRPMPGSPAIDAGLDLISAGIVGAPTTDPDGAPRPSGNGFDIGAYEVQ